VDVLKKLWYYLLSMMLNIKNLSGKYFKVEVSENDSIASVKEKLEKTANVPVSKQTLVCDGKILLDSKTIKEIGLVF
jgi:hypothetical protein